MKKKTFNAPEVEIIHYDEEAMTLVIPISGTTTPEEGD